MTWGRCTEFICFRAAGYVNTVLNCETNFIEEGDSFTEIDSLVSCLQEPATSPCPEPDECSPRSVSSSCILKHAQASPRPVLVVPTSIRMNRVVRC